MCGYARRSTRGSTDLPGLRAQVGRLASMYRGERVAKIYTSGSFLDDGEVPPDVRLDILRTFNRAEKVVIESRCDMVSEERIVPLTAHPGLEVALGLESSDDTVLARCVNKGSTLEDYVRAVSSLRGQGIGVRTYVLLKPPFMGEHAAVEDAVRTMEVAARYSDVVSLNPVTVHAGSLVEHLFRRGEYAPPWLWSVDTVLKRAVRGTLTLCSTVAFGKRRGPHNCGRCDRSFLERVRRFNLGQRLEGGVECACRERWRYEMSTGRMLAGHPPRWTRRGQEER